jgi:hypothetical protein
VSKISPDFFQGIGKLIRWEYFASIAGYQVEFELKIENENENELEIKKKGSSPPLRKMS